MDNKKILLVDDESINRKILTKLLENEYEIVQAANGKEALEALKKERKVEAILLDLLMPVMDGYEFMEKIRGTSYGSYPIIVMTGDEKQETEEKALEAGAWDFVTKPYNARILKTRLKNAIARSEMAALEKMRYLDRFDPLTALNNKNGFYELTERLLERNQDRKSALVTMDINRFSLINSLYGIEKGDELLKFLADILKKHLKELPSCTYGRIEADQFAFCIPYETRMDIELILHTLSTEIKTVSISFDVTLNFGVYPVEDKEIPVFKMLDYAKMAAKTVKGNYVQNFAFYEPTFEENLVVDQQITNEMNRALEAEEFCVYLQPKYDIRSNRSVGAEALVRWKHPTKGMISPGVFIPVFEKNGFILKLDYYMWEHVCMLFHEWMQAGEEPAPISVNISRVSLFDPLIVEKIVGLTKKYNVPPKLLNLEITESAYMDEPDLMKRIVSELRSLGFLILMDDFGSGYSSLNTLKDIEVDILKIDMKFLPTGKDNVKSEKILASITRMAGWIGMPVVVEGVETKEQLMFLEEIGCGYVQGYYFAKPMPVPDYVALMQGQEQGSEVKQQVMASTKEMDDFWLSNNEMLSVMKGITVPFAIYEYSKEHLEIIRTNSNYREEFPGFCQGTEEDQTYLFQSQWMKFYCAFDDAIQNLGMSECELLFCMLNGETKWYRIRIQYICGTATGSILCATYIDVTAEKAMELEISRSFGRLDGKTGTGRGKILIIDDSVMSREIMASLFESEFDILHAADGFEGLQLLSENAETIEIILLDLMMPNMDGREFLLKKKLVERFEDIPVVVISADSDENMQLQMLKYGVHDYITKPFVPEIVKRRVKNVLDYNGRFKKLLREFNENNNVPVSEGPGKKDVYLIPEIMKLRSYLMTIFDVVRLVQPETTTVLKLEEDGSIGEEAYSCFQVWKKSTRCENCTSVCANSQMCQLTKYEFIENDIFYVISRPIILIEKNGKVRRCVMEIVSHISDSILNHDAEAEKSIKNLLDSTQRKIYTDELSGTFNRRYWSEMRFLYKNNVHSAANMAVIMLDLMHFKQINDHYGHLEGDRILVDVAKELQSQIRSRDSIIRYGGDEFLVVLVDCKQIQVDATIKRLRKAVQNVRYGEQKEHVLDAAFGYSFTEKFVPDANQLQQMFAEADQRMYVEKKKQK